MGAIGKLAMWNRIRAATTAAATAATVVVLTLTQQGGAAQSAEIKVFSSAAPRGIFRELAPDFERTTGHRLVIHYEFAADLERRIEAGDPFDVAVLPPDMADDLVRRGKAPPGRASTSAVPVWASPCAGARRNPLSARLTRSGGPSSQHRRSPTPTAEQAAYMSMACWRGSGLPMR
jgi:hypothetical protein